MRTLITLNVQYADNQVSILEYSVPTGDPTFGILFSYWIITPNVPKICINGDTFLVGLGIFVACNIVSDVRG